MYTDHVHIYRLHVRLSDMIPDTRTTSAVGDDRGVYSTRFLTASSFSLSSIVMILLNKYAMRVYPYSLSLLLLQNLSTVGLLRLANSGMEFQGMSEWLPCAMLFCFNIISSMESLIRISVPTFTTFRNAQPLIAVFVDRFARAESTSWNSGVYLCLIFMGTVIYCMHELDYNLYGYIWAVSHILSMSVYSVIVKMKATSLNLSATEMSLYNNILSIPLLSILQVADLLFQQDGLQTQGMHTHSCSVHYECIVLVALSCVGGFAVSVSGFKAQQALSPISWLTLNNISKIPAVVLSLLLFGGSLSPMSVCGMCASMVAGYLYSLSRQPDFSSWSQIPNMVGCMLALCLVCCTWYGQPGYM